MDFWVLSILVLAASDVINAQFGRFGSFNDRQVNESDPTVPELHRFDLEQERRVVHLNVPKRSRNPSLVLAARRLCENRSDTEYFRLTDTLASCGRVVRCDREWSSATVRLAAISCPESLLFDIEKQTCDWAFKVTSHTVFK
jgi:hypothetical protein